MEGTALFFQRCWIIIKSALLLKKEEERMRKWGIFFGFFVCLALIFALHCKSPASSEQALPAGLSESETGSTSNSGSSGNGGSSGGSSVGTLTILMKDKPVEEALHILVTINSIKVHSADTGEFIEVSNFIPDIDLIDLKNNAASLAEAMLAAGHYNQIRMDVVEGSIVFQEDNGEGGFDKVPYDLKIPSNEIKIPVQFYMQENATVRIFLDFDAEKSIKVTKQGKKDSYILRPVIKVMGVNY
jgi:hypothetical protein